MTVYIYDQEGWPAFEWDAVLIGPRLAATSRRQGRLIGRMESLGFELRSEAVLTTLTEDVLRSSEIEGERFDREQVRSSVARRLGLDVGALLPADRNVEGVVEMMLDATQNYAELLTQERLFAWHAAMFPTGRSGMTRIRVGAWRDDAKGPMQVVSGPVGRERVHFQAPEAGRLEQETDAFLSWCERHEPIDPVLKAALAHLWFVTLHPFDDGNGRIARAIADMMLARSESSPQRFYSMSARIRVERNAYYEILETTQKGGMDVTGWIFWFLDCLDGAIEGAEDMLGAILAKAAFWQRMRDVPLNPRQAAMLNRLLDGFEGKLTSSKWAKIMKVSPDTALRDITDLVSRCVLEREEGGGRSTSYRLADGDPG